MKISERLEYTIVLNTICVGVIVVIDMLFKFGLFDLLSSPVFAGVSLVTFYLLAPYIKEKIRLG
jgi:hypothetical protein